MRFRPEQDPNYSSKDAPGLRLCPEQRGAFVDPILNFFFGPGVILDSVTFHTVASFTVVVVFLSLQLYPKRTFSNHIIEGAQLHLAGCTSSFACVALAAKAWGPVLPNTPGSMTMAMC